MNNIPVFPSQCSLPENQCMTLRDYFAAKAMQVVIWDDRHLDECARRCYQKADAMLAARSKE